MTQKALALWLGLLVLMLGIAAIVWSIWYFSPQQSMSRYCDVAVLHYEHRDCMEAHGFRE